MFNNAYIQSNTGYVQSINQSIICSYKADNSYITYEKCMIKRNIALASTTHNLA